MFSCNRHGGNELYIIHAGSFSYPLKKLAKEFNSQYPELKILTEACGSVDCARRISELGKSADIFISADYNIVEEMIIPTHSSWQLPFVNNSMVIAYTPVSRYSSDIDYLNWMEILLQDDVVFGRSDPNADPCGYRTLLLLQLSEKEYGRKGLYENFTTKNTNFIRPKEVDLLGLLQSNALDYIFIYKSVAVQQGLEYIELSPRINLGFELHRQWYANAGIDIRGSKPGTTIRITAEPIMYSLTIPASAKNHDAAIKFINFMLTDGGNLLRAAGHDVMMPQQPPENLPQELKESLYGVPQKE